MKLNLSSNIQSFRKKRGLTQEQLAEAMGVSVGAVSKWENGLSNPDIALIPELADFFEISVDVLLGYEMHSHSAAQTSGSIRSFNLAKQFDEGCALARKALQKYPNNFDVVYNAAEIFANTGLESHDKPMMQRAQELYNHAAQLIEQNTNPQINYDYIQIRIGDLYAFMGDNEMALTYLRRYNIDGVNDDRIGSLLTEMGQYDEALSVLSENLLSCIGNLFNGSFAMLNCFANTGREQEALELCDWLETVFKGLAGEKEHSYAHTMRIALLTFRAIVCARLRDEAAAREALIRAVQIADMCGDSPDFSSDSLKFYHGKPHSLYDDMGGNARQTIHKLLTLAADENKDNALFAELAREF